MLGSANLEFRPQQSASFVRSYDPKAGRNRKTLKRVTQYREGATYLIEGKYNHEVILFVGIYYKGAFQDPCSIEIWERDVIEVYEITSVA